MTSDPKLVPAPAHQAEHQAAPDDVGLAPTVDDNGCVIVGEFIDVHFSHDVEVDMSAGEIRCAVLMIGSTS